MSNVVPLHQVAANLPELWSPRVVGEVDDFYAKVARIQGEFTWHSHDNEDEMFLVLKGEMQIEMDAETVSLGEGDLFIVPKGVRHRPHAQQECHILLMERKSTLHTGGKIVPQTRSIEQQIRPE